MFGLLRLLAWVALGYVAYELYQGMSEGAGSQGGGGGGQRGRGRSDLGRALNEGTTGRMGTLTGPGRGTTVGTEDFQGGRSTHVVGRGVVSE